MIGAAADGLQGRRNADSGNAGDPADIQFVDSIPGAT
jgi:hypothetical protein